MESVPKETETIAHKRALRLSEKLQQAQARIYLKNAWWASASSELIGLLILFAMNFLLVMPSIGLPADSIIFSGPVVPLVAKAITLTGVPFNYAIQLVNVIFFLAFPMTFYFFVKFVSGRKFSAFISALIVTLPLYLFAKTRLEYGLFTNDSPFIASLSVLPVTLVVLLKFLRIGGIGNLTNASLITALLGLISPFGFFIFMIASCVVTFSEMLLGDGRVKILRLLTIYLFSASLVSFWYNPGFFFWLFTGPLGEGIRSMLKKLIPVSLFILPVLGSLGYLLFDRKPHLQPFVMASFFSVVFLIIVMAGGGLFPSNPGRYIPVLGVGLAFLIGIGVLMFIEHINNASFLKFAQFPGVKNAFLLVISISLMAFTILGKDMAFESQSDVLGVWTDVQKGDIWNIRDKFHNTVSIPGYLITATGAGTLVYLGRKKQT